MVNLKNNIFFRFLFGWYRIYYCGLINISFKKIKTCFECVPIFFLVLQLGISSRFLSVRKIKIYTLKYEIGIYNAHMRPAVFRSYQLFIMAVQAISKFIVYSDYIYKLVIYCFFNAYWKNFTHHKVVRGAWRAAGFWRTFNSALMKLGHEGSK